MIARASSGSMVDVLHQLHRALDISEQRGDGLALTVEIPRDRTIDYANW
jgi:hypothetical protein